MIFTLEHGVGNVVARHAVDIRICSCPKRDKIQDEKKRTEDLKKANKLAGNLSRANSSLMYVPLEKKRKLETGKSNFHFKILPLNVVLEHAVNTCGTTTVLYILLLLLETE